MELREENKPRFLIKPLSTRAGRGEDAVFSCKIWGNPKPDVVWEKDGKKLNDIFESTHFSVGSQDGGWFQLKIFKTRAPDGGVYTCKARNEFGEALAGAVLLVDAGPGHEDEANRNGYTNGHWKSAPGRSGRPAPNRPHETMTKTAKVKMFAVTEGKHAKFRCFVTGKPKPEIIWRKDGRLILSGRRYLLYEDREGYFTLKVLYCKQKDNGVYVCAASNTAGQTLSAVHLSVKEPPVRFKQPLIDLEVWERDLAVLECEVPEDSVPITWYLEDRRLQPGDKYDMEQWGTKRRLTIRDIGVDDDGIYLCEMPDGGRSIAEVAVKGTIVRKLPRKVDVLEGENAAFCVEVEKEEMDIHWYKDGVELRETHQTILKSFGRTHILVFVNTMPQDTGQVMFFVGRSKTSSQLRVKAARHCPPSAPVGVQINTERANAALLSWIPAQDSRKNPPSGYVLERQEVGTGSQEWLQCLTTDSATSVEILGDSVPCEADYRFRICSVNKYGKSNNVEFPRTVHLVPVARIQAPLQDALVPEGQDALFSIELTASIIGTWFLNGTQIQEDERFSMRRTRTHQSLRIRGVRDTDNGAEITFIAYGIRDSAALYIQAPLVKFSPLSEMDRNKFVEMGNPIVLYCELSDPAAPVHWYKNGVELQTTEGLHIQSEGTMRRIVIQSAEFCHSGVYCCDAIDDVIRFNVEVEAPPVRFSAVPESERSKRVHCGRPLLLQCEVSEASAQVQWYKDGSKVLPQSGLELLSEARLRKLLVHSAELYHTGLYSCKTKGDAVSFTVDVTAPLVVFEPVSEEARVLCVCVGRPIELRCSVSDPQASVRWLHGDTELGPDSGCLTRAEGCGRTLCVESAEMCHSGVYSCSTGDDCVEFTVHVQAIPAPTVFERRKSLEAVVPLELECEVPDSAFSICWFKDDRPQLPPKQNQIWEELTENRERQITSLAPPAESLQSDLKRLETKDDTVHVTGRHKASSPLPPTSDAIETVEESKEMCAQKDVGAAQTSAQLCKKEISEVQSEADALEKELITENPSKSYYCATADEVAQLIAKVEKTSPLAGPSSIVQQFEISDPVAKARWYKDGTPICSKMEEVQDVVGRSSVEEPVVSSRHSCDLGQSFSFGHSRLSCCPVELSSPGQIHDVAKSRSPEQVFSQAQAIFCLTHRKEEVSESAKQAVPSREAKGGFQSLAHLRCVLKNDATYCFLFEQSRVTFPTVRALSRTQTLWKTKLRDGERRRAREGESLKKSPEEESLKKSPEEDSLEEKPEEGSQTEEPAEQERPEEQRPEGEEGPKDETQTELVCSAPKLFVGSSIGKPETNANPEHSRPSLHAVLRSQADAVSLKEVNRLFDTKAESVSRRLSGKVPLQFKAESVASEALSEVSKAILMSLKDPSVQTERVQTTLCENSTGQSNSYRFSSKEEDFIYFTQHRVSESEDRSTASAQSHVLHQTFDKPALSLSPLQSVSRETAVGQRAELHSPDSSADASLGHLQHHTLTSDVLHVTSDPGAKGTRTQPSLETLRSSHRNSLRGVDSVRVQTLSEQCLNTEHLSHVQSESSHTAQTSVRREDLHSTNCLLSAEPETCLTTQTTADVNRLEPSMSRMNCQNLYQTTDTCLDLSDSQTQELKGFTTNRIHLEEPASSSASPSVLQSLLPVEAQSSLYQNPCAQTHLYSSNSVFSNSLQSVCDRPDQAYSSPQTPSHQSKTLSMSKTVKPDLQQPHRESSSITANRPHTEPTSDHQIKEDCTDSEEFYFSKVFGDCCVDRVTANKVAEGDSNAPVTLTAVGETHRSCDTGQDIDLICEVSDPKEPVSWFKDGAQVSEGAALKITSHDSQRRLSIASAAPGQSGVYSCRTASHAVQFHVDVKAPLLRFSALPEAEQRKTVEQGHPLALQCELSHASGQVTWYKDGAELLPEGGVDIQSEGLKRSVYVPAVERQHCGVYRCESKDDDIQFTVDVRDSAVKDVKFLEIGDSDRKQQVVEGSPVVLRCELSQEPSEEVSWSKDGEQILPDSSTDMREEGLVRTLKIHKAEARHSGVYECSTNQHKVQFEVDVKGRAPHILPLSLSDTHKLVCVGAPIVLQCQVSEAAAQVTWAKDHVELFCRTGLDMKRDGCLRKLMVHCAKACDAGSYSCSLQHNTVTFNVHVQASPVRFSPLPDVAKNKFVEAGCPIVLQCEVSEASALVFWHKDGCLLLPEGEYELQSTDRLRSLEIRSAQLKHRGLYSCAAADNSITFKVDVAAPPVTFREIPEEDLLKTVVEQEELALTCEVSAPEGEVLWYKDGAEIQPNDSVDVQAEGTTRSLIVRSAQLSDTGTFSCRTGDSVVMFKVTVREPPVMIVHPKEDVHLDRHVPEEVILSCELSRANGAVSWFKDGQKLQESENIKLKVEGPYRRLKILSSRVEDSGEYVCDTEHDSIFFQLNITEPPVRIVSPSQSQMELCQQTSERMVLSCEISRPNAVVRWYRDGLQVEESPNLLIEEDGVYRRLIIPKTTVQDSAEYVCDTADDSMTFFVNIAEPPVRFVRPRKSASKVEKEAGESVVLECEVSRPNAEVTWKRNGDEVEDMKNISVLEEGVLRQLTIHALNEEDAGQYVCDAKDDLMDFTVTVREPPVRIVGKPEGRTEKTFCVSDDIILVCELSRANAAVTWSRDGRPLQDSERYCAEEQGVFRSLVVLNAELQDSGEYSCEAGDDSMLFYITVRDPPVQIVGNSGSPEHHLLQCGEDLVLECEVSRADADVRWLRNGEELRPDDRVNIQSCDVVRKFVLMDLQTSDSGEYTCDAADDRMITIVEVQEPPACFINKPSRPSCLTAFEGESVTLTAELTRELGRGQAVRWLKDGQLLNAENIHISSSGAEQRLTLSPLQLCDSGEYVCDAITDQTSFSLTVREMKVKFVRSLQSTVALKGHSLTLQCEVNKAKGDVQWLKDGQEVALCRRFTIRALGRERSFTIHQVSEEDAGEYVCASTDDRTSATVTVQNPRVVEFIAGLRNVTVREGEDAVFKCVVSPEDASLVWQINGRAPPGQRAAATQNGTCHTLRLSQCRLKDSGRVSANAEGQVSTAELQVQEPQVVFTRQMCPVTAEEFGEALLEVEVSQDSEEVQWMRQGVVLHAGPKYSLLKQGRAHSLRIHQLVLSDSGRFSCETLHDRTQAQLTVTPRKISITKGLSDVRTTERETASFEVHLSHPDVPGSWFRNGTRLKASAHFRLSCKGLVHSLTISNLSVEDTGSFMFCVEEQKSTARLVVREPPVSIFKKLEDQRFPDGAVISIECELSRHNVDVKWMKNGVEVKPSKELRIYAMGRKRFLQVMKCRVSDSGVYTCDAGDASTSCSVEVYERELVILQELEDVDIQEDQNAVFMCEVSVEDVLGQWFKKGEKILNTSTVKTRQEGTKHFLLMCNVRPEDSGEIKFVARHVESVAYLDVEELPVSIGETLRDQTVMEKTRVLLDCTVSNPRCSCRWYRGCSVILPSERFEICSEGCIRKLIIQQVALEDEGTYSVQVESTAAPPSSPWRVRTTSRRRV
ncbi:hypothetical protein WMY93_001975 [Mugilogobius chulae]|uniref:Obscurin-like protein 1 n=1 Tax=Mugilogobius chulae TaxID=88201 RepID=A0AAW0PV01_9GOBI